MRSARARVLFHVAYSSILFLLGIALLMQGAIAGGAILCVGAALAIMVRTRRIRR